MRISVYLTSAPKGSADIRLRQVCFRVREGAADLRTRTSLLADPEFWDEAIPGYRRTTKLTEREIKDLNKKIEDITVLIHEQYSENCGHQGRHHDCRGYKDCGGSGPPKTRESVEHPIYLEVTTHTARKTFIANLYRLVKDPALIASMTGHTENSKAFRRYRAIEEEMKKELVTMMD